LEHAPRGSREAGDFYYVNWDYAVERVPAMTIFVNIATSRARTGFHSNGPDLSGPDSAAGIGEFQIDY